MPCCCAREENEHADHYMVEMSHSQVQLPVSTADLASEASESESAAAEFPHGLGSASADEAIDIDALACGDEDSRAPFDTLEASHSARLPAPARDLAPTPSESKSAVVGKARGLSNASEDPALSLVVTFQGRAELLRASRLFSVMHCCAALFANSASSVDTWALSEQVARIDAFISHNWVVRRTKKFFCLALHFNLKSAIVAEVGILVLIAAAGIRVGPKLVRDEGGPRQGEMRLVATVLMAPVFLAVLLFGHEFRRLACLRGPRIFLDKTCIHQQDETLQRDGVLRLGAFLRNSSQMVIIYTDVYLTKLWTVYEVACFLSMHASNRIVVIPTELPLTIFCGVIIQYVGRLSYLAMPTLFYPCMFLALFGYAAFLRSWARTKERIQHRIANFEVRACTCLVEDDRSAVYSNIAVLMQAIGEVGDDATEQDALAAFNSLVRRRLPTSLALSMGPFGWGYLQMVAVFLQHSLPTLVDNNLLGIYQEPVTTRHIVCRAVYQITWACGLLPILVMLLSIWCGRCLHVGRWREIAFLALGVVMFALLWSAWWILLKTLNDEAIDGSYRNLCLAGSIIVMFAAPGLAITSFVWARQVKDEH